MNLNPIDLAVIVVYFVLMLAFGLWCSHRNKNSERYFLGGRDFKGWVLGISFIGSMISSVSFIATPADAFKTTWIRYTPYFAFPVLVLICAYIFIPFFRRGTVTSAYEYLSLRFGNSISAYGAVVFLVAQIIRTASIIYLLAVLMATLTGISVEWALIISGGITAIYTTKGGYEAVIWTDVIQTVILVGGAILILGVLLYEIPGGAIAAFQEAFAAGKFSLTSDLNTTTGALEPIAHGFSFSEKTVVMLLLVGLTQYIAGKLNQESVQRWCSAKSAKEARKSMFVLGGLSLPIWAIFMCIGTFLWVYYKHAPDAVSQAILSGELKAEGILPHFIITQLPVGISGIVISAALAAAMSTLSSATNAASMVFVNDLYRKYWVKAKADTHYLHIGKLSSLCISAGMIVVGYIFHLASSKTMSDFLLIVLALIGGGIAGIFLFGMFSRRGDARAVLAGIACTLTFTGYALLMQFKIVPQSFDPYYTAIIGNIVMLVVSYTASFIFPAKKRDMTNLTVWDWSKRPLK